MSKIKLPETSGLNTLRINDNFQKIEDELNEKVLYRDNPSGEPNEMHNDLDMNGNRIYNLPKPVSESEPLRRKDVLDAISATEDAKDAANRANDAADRADDAVENMEEDFQEFLLNSGYQDLGDYGAGLEITARNQIFWRNGELYRAGAVLELPYTTTGDWGTEGSLFVAVGDAALRQELAAPGGSSMVGFKQDVAGAINRSVADKLKEHVSVQDFGAVGDGVTNDTAAIASVPRDGREYDGMGKVYLVDHLPSDMAYFKRAAFKVGRLLYPTADFFQGADFAKATNARAYTAWPQDSAYVMGNKIRAFVNYGDAHLDGDIKCAYITSEDGGTSWSEPVVLLPDQSGWTCWSAGYSGGYEMAIVRLGDTAPWRYRLYRRAMPEDSSGEESTPWVYYTLTFPMPSWVVAHDQPVMVHSFTTGPNGRIVVGLSFQEGVALAYSDNNGLTWTLGPDLLITADASEPTVKYENGIYCGFIRGGFANSRPRFWISRDNLATVQVYTSTPEWFGSRGLQAATVPLQIKDGIVHAFTSQRSGLLAGQTDDKPTPAYYIRADLSKGDNIWSHADIFEIGTLWHMELGGASACGQGSVVIYQDRVIVLTGSEERTGIPNSKNRRANVWSLSLPLKNGLGLFDQRRFPARDASANNPFIQTASGFAVLENKRFMTSKTNAYSDAAKIALAKSTSQRIIDGGVSNSAHVIATDGNYADWTSITHDGLESGIRIDNTNGTILFRVGSAILGRWYDSDSSFRPETDSAQPLGGPTRKWSELFASTGTISTSDIREKQQQRDLTVVERTIAHQLKPLLKAFKWDSAVEKKGEKARWHFGIMAQEVAQVFADNGLDAHDYAMFCYDEWDETLEIKEPILDAEGNETGEFETVQGYQPAGNCYGIRYDQLLAFIISAM